MIYPYISPAFPYTLLGRLSIEQKVEGTPSEDEGSEYRQKVYENVIVVIAGALSL